MADEDKGKHPDSSGSVHPLSRIQLQLDGDTARRLGDAEHAIRSLEHSIDSPLLKQGFVDARLHIESMAALKMKGRQTTVRQAFRKTVQTAKKAEGDPSAKKETLHDSEALVATCDLGKKPIRPNTFAEIHCHLVSGTTREPFKGQLRSSSKQVGGSRYHEFGEPYVMPEPEAIPALLSDLALFCDSDNLPAVAQAALAHVQLIAIHPFERANGKTARALVQLVFRHRNLIDRTVVPLSLAMVISSHDYQHGVIAAMKALEAHEPSQHELNKWLSFFSSCCICAVDETLSFEQEVSSLQNDWLKRLGSRSDSATTLLIQALPGIPVFTAAGAAEYIGRSFKRTTTAIDELIAAGIVEQVTEGKRNRVFECPDIIDAYAHITSFQ